MQKAGSSKNIVFAWSASVGRNYQFQTSTNLGNSGNWQNYMSPISATNSTMGWSDTIGSGKPLYYRLQTQ